MRPAMDEQGKGWRLRAARAELGLSEEALANELRRWAELRGEPRPDITADTIAEWEGDVRPVDVAAIPLLWLVLEVPTGDRPAFAGGLGTDVWSLFRPARPLAGGGGERRRDLVRYLAALGEPAGLDPERLSAAVAATASVDRRLVENLGFVARQLPLRWGRDQPHLLRQHIHGRLRTVPDRSGRPLGLIRRALTWKRE